MAAILDLGKNQTAQFEGKHTVLYYNVAYNKETHIVAHPLQKNPTEYSLLLNYSLDATIRRKTNFVV